MNHPHRGSGIRCGRYRIACRLKSNSEGRRTSSASAMPSRVADVVERTVDGQRGRRQDRRAHPVDEQRADDRGDVDRRRAQEHAASAKLDEEDVVVVSRTEQETQLGPQLAGPAHHRLRCPRAPHRRPRPPSSGSSRLRRRKSEQLQRRFEDVERPREVRGARRRVCPSDSGVARTRSSDFRRPSPRCANATSLKNAAA